MNKNLFFLLTTFAYTQLISMEDDFPVAKIKYNSMTENYNAIKALHTAVKESNIDNIQSLVYAGVNVNAQDHEGLAALHYAALNQNPQVTDLLLSLHANPNVQHSDGKTPLHFAVRARNNAIIPLLIAAGADCHTVDHNGNIPEDLTTSQKTRNLCKRKAAQNKCIVS